MSKRNLFCTPEQLAQPAAAPALTRSGHRLDYLRMLCHWNCLSVGATIFWNFWVQLLQQPDKVTLIYPHDSDFRVVRLNQPHPATVVPSIHGDSVGHYEDGALVIDTVGIKLGPHRMIDRFGTPYTQSLHVVERYRLLDYEATKEALERAEKEWPRAGGAIDPNYPYRPNFLAGCCDKGQNTTAPAYVLRPSRDVLPDWLLATPLSRPENRGRISFLYVTALLVDSKVGIVDFWGAKGWREFCHPSRANEI